MRAIIVRSLGLAVSLATWAVVHATTDPEIDLTGYRRATSPHVSVQGKVTDDVLRATASALEVVHDEMVAITGLGGGTPRFRVDVTVLADGDSLGLTERDGHPAPRRSAFQSTPASPRIALFASSGAESVERAAHEYVHAFLDLHVGRVPFWLEEALADFFATVALHADGVVIGSVPEVHRTVLRERGPASTSELLALPAADAKLSPPQSAAAWALVHLLATGDEAGPQLGDVLRRLASNEPATRALLRGTGRTAVALDEQIRGVALAEDLPVRRRALPPSATALALGDVAPEEIAARQIEELADETTVDALREQAPGSAHLRVAIGVVDAANGRYETAAAELRRAIELGLSEPRVHWNLGVVLVELATSERAGASPPTALLAEARDHLQEVVDVFPRCQPCWIQLAIAHMAAGAEARFVIEPLERAFETGPARHELLMLLGEARMRMGRLDDGCRAFEMAMKRAGSGDASAEARELLVECLLETGHGLSGDEAQARYDRALSLATNLAERQELRRRIAAVHADRVLVDLAHEFTRAVQRAEKGDVAGAIPILERIVAQSTDAYLRDVARERLARYRSRSAAKPGR